MYSPCANDSGFRCDASSVRSGSLSKRRIGVRRRTSTGFINDIAELFSALISTIVDTSVAGISARLSAK